MNPDKVRELHRAWVVEHAEARQAPPVQPPIIWDEDWAAGMVDVSMPAAASGASSSVFPDSAYEIPAPNLLSSFTYDLIGGQYVLVTHTGETEGYRVGVQRPSSYFTPDAMAGGGIR